MEAEWSAGGEAGVGDGVVEVVFSVEGLEGFGVGSSGCAEDCGGVGVEGGGKGLLGH